MDMKKTIIHYIGVYSGSEKRVKRYTVDDHMWDFGKKSDCEKAVRDTLMWLTANGYITTIAYSDMTTEEKRYYESDKCVIYRIIKRLNETE